MMLNLRNMYAQYLSSQGKHCQALKISQFKDIKVLVNAGMYLSAANLTSKPSPELILAYIKMLEFDKAFQLLDKKIPLKKRKNTILGLLAFHNPPKVLEFAKFYELTPDILYYSTLQVEGYEKAEILNIVELVSPLLRYSAYLPHNPKCALEFFQKVWANCGLLAPQFANDVVDLSRISCNGVQKVQIQNPPLVSIVLTAYNEEKNLPFSIQSILNQTWKNIELIVVNDGSTDNTLEIAKKFAQTDKRIQVIALKKNVGLWKAKNIAFEECTGEFFTMHDADDWSHPLKIEKQITPLIRDKTIQATSSNYFRIDEKTKQVFARNINKIISWNPSSFMFRSHILKKLGNFFDKGLGMDCEFVERLETLYSPKAHLKIQLPLSIGLNRQISLSNQQREKGEGGEKRILDWENWQKEMCANF